MIITVSTFTLQAGTSGENHWFFNVAIGELYFNQVNLTFFEVGLWRWKNPKFTTWQTLGFTFRLFFIPVMWKTSRVDQDTLLDGVPIIGSPFDILDND